MLLLLLHTMVIKATQVQMAWHQIGSAPYAHVDIPAHPRHTHGRAHTLSRYLAPPHPAVHLSCLVAFSVHKQSLLSCCAAELSVPLHSRGLSPAAAVHLCVYRSEGAANSGQAFTVITHSFQNARTQRKANTLTETGGNRWKTCAGAPSSGSFFRSAASCS